MNCLCRCNLTQTLVSLSHLVARMQDIAASSLSCKLHTGAGSGIDLCESAGGRKSASSRCVNEWEADGTHYQVA